MSPRHELQFSEYAQLVPPSPCSTKEPSTSSDSEDQSDAKAVKTATARNRMRLTPPQGKGRRSEVVNGIPNMEGEWGNVVWLVVLYAVQGIPLGIAAAMPLVLADAPYNLSFGRLGTFSLCSWPFSLKLLWAPLVDGVYSNRMGKHKTWLIPSQLAIGVLCLIMALFINTWMGGNPEGEVHIGPLTGFFFAIYFLCSTQDIAIDGWSLNMLRPENVGYASTCNTAGQIAGYIISFGAVMGFQGAGIMSWSWMMVCCGIMYIALALCLAAFKKENASRPAKGLGKLKIAYANLLTSIRLPAVQQLAFMLLLWRLPFAANDAIMPLKLLASGMDKSMLVVSMAAVVPAQIIVPVVIGKMTAGPRPLEPSRIAFLPRLFGCCAAVCIIGNMPESIKTRAPIGIPDVAYYIILMVFMFLYQVVSTCIFCGQVAFFSRVADKSVGGSYLTMLNTFATLGTMWTNTAALKAADYTTITDASGKEIVSSYAVLVAITFLIGIIGYPSLCKLQKDLQNRPKSDWKVDIKEIQL